MIPWVTTTHRCLRYSYRNKFGGFQVLLRETRVLGIKVWSTEIDREDFPSWAAIQQATLGSTDWKSRLLEQYKDVLT